MVAMAETALRPQRAQRPALHAHCPAQNKYDSLSDLTLDEALKMLDGKTDLQRALEASATLEAIHAELKMMDEQIDSADQVAHMIDRASELAEEIVTIKMRAQMECGRLARELEQVEA
jgi:hypothetical protein